MVNEQLIKAYRSGALEKEGLTRLIFDLTGPAVVDKAFVLARDATNRDRLVIDLAPSSRNLFTARTADVYGNREMANRFRHYDRWRERVDGFVALGDAACKFNPIHGQGMTSAAVCAGILHATIARVGLASPELPRVLSSAAAPNSSGEAGAGRGKRGLHPRRLPPR